MLHCCSFPCWQGKARMGEVGLNSHPHPNPPPPAREGTDCGVFTQYCLLSTIIKSAYFLGHHPLQYLQPMEYRRLANILVNQVIQCLISVDGEPPQHHFSFQAAFASRQGSLKTIRVQYRVCPHAHQRFERGVAGRGR